jgi:hypothetical protein
MIRKNRHIIKIKINDHMVNLTKQTYDVVGEASRNLKLFDKEASQICGKTWE